MPVDQASFPEKESAQTVDNPCGKSGSLGRFVFEYLNPYKMEQFDSNLVES